MANYLETWRDLGPNILADPNNDRLRLQFAAALEETAPENFSAEARFIRLQLALARTSPSSTQWMGLALEADSLLLDHKKEWLPKWISDAEVPETDFHRGFLESIAISLRSLLEMRSRIFIESPVRHLTIFDISQPDDLRGAFDVLESDGHLSNLISLQLDGQNLTDREVETLDRRSLRNLRWLSLANNEIDVEGARTLTNENLQALEFVDLHGNPFDPVEKLTFDQGVVIDRSMAHLPADFRRVPWLTRQVVSGLLFQPSRWDSVHGYDPEDEDGGSTPLPLNLDNSGSTSSSRGVVENGKVGAH